jgi:hypothetical protein
MKKQIKQFWIKGLHEKNIIQMKIMKTEIWQLRNIVVEIELTNWSDQISPWRRVGDGDVHWDEDQEESDEEADPVVAAVEGERERRKRRNRKQRHRDVVRDQQRGHYPN